MASSSSDLLCHTREARVVAPAFLKRGRLSAPEVAALRKLFPGASCPFAPDDSVLKAQVVNGIDGQTYATQGRTTAMGYRGKLLLLLVYLNPQKPPLRACTLFVCTCSGDTFANAEAFQMDDLLILDTIYSRQTRQVDFESFGVGCTDEPDTAQVCLRAPDIKTKTEWVACLRQTIKDWQAFIGTSENDGGPLQHFRTVSSILSNQETAAAELMFKRIDKHSSGEIDPSEMLDALTHLRPHRDMPSLIVEVKEMFDLADRDHNGRIDLDEFLAVYNQLRLTDMSASELLETVGGHEFDNFERWE